MIWIACTHVHLLVKEEPRNFTQVTIRDAELDNLQIEGQALNKTLSSGERLCDNLSNITLFILRNHKNP